MPATCSACGDISVIPYCSNLRCPVSPIIKNNPIVNNQSLVLRTASWDEDLEELFRRALREAFVSDFALADLHDYHFRASPICVLNGKNFGALGIRLNIG